MNEQGKTQKNRRQEVMQRFLRYVKIHTTSKEGVDHIPSTERQFKLANLLVQELQELGIKDASVDEHCVVTGTLESNLSAEESKKVPTLLFNAHLDTSPDELGQDVKPRIIQNYDGKDIALDQEESVILSTEETPELKKFIGTDLIVTDGTTLLGADDKAGVAAIMTAIHHLVNHPEKKHGTVKIVFTPDEEVGKGTDALDVSAMDVDYGYTIDGDEMGVLEAENFNAAGGSIHVKGYNVHPGYAYGKMVNAIRIINDIIAIFPADEAPETTQKYEGYYHVHSVQATVNEAHLKFILRDFDYQELQNKMTYLKDQVQSIREQYPKAEIDIEIKESYRNMKEIIDQHPIVVEVAEEAIQRAGIEVIRKPIRGGTDGARMSFDGLPTPNIFSGGLNFHSKKECIPIIALEKCVETILNIIDVFMEKSH